MEESNIECFDVTCKNCGSKNILLWGYCGQNRGFGSLECAECKSEETVSDTGDKS